MLSIVLASLQIQINTIQSHFFKKNESNKRINERRVLFYDKIFIPILYFYVLLARQSRGQ
jgi:hypothetical protein